MTAAGSAASASGRSCAAAPQEHTLPDFDRLARAYRWLEYLSFGRLLERTRTQWLPAFASARNALVLGDGDGRFTAALLATNTKVRVHAVDGSAAMLHQLQLRCSGNPGRVTTEQADLRAWMPEPVSGGYDLVVTHFFLDCLSSAEIAALAQRLTPALAPEAKWVVSDFAVPQGGYGRWFARPLIWLLYVAFGMLTGLHVRHLPDHAGALRQAGWRLYATHRRAGGLLFSQMWKRAGVE